MCQEFNISLQIHLFFEQLELRLVNGCDDNQKSWKRVFSDLCLNFASKLNVTLNFGAEI